MSLMLEEIYQQPAVISTMVNSERNAVIELVKEIKKRGINSVNIAARGTSDHAAIYGKYLLELYNALPVALADPSIVTLYNGRMKFDNTLVIGVSQSGAATDVIEYLEQAKKDGALTLGITNVPGSPLAKASDYTILTCAEEEFAVAATKTYTSTLAAFYLLSATLAENNSRIDQLIASADAMTSVLDTDNYLKSRAERYRYMEAGVVLSRGFNYSTALELALKLSETCYIKMKGFSEADFLHGPIATIHQGDPCFLVAPAGKTYDRMLEMAKRLKARNAESMIFSTEDEILDLATVPVKMNCTITEDLSPLVYIIPGQLFSHHLSIARGNNPDKPSGLSKVTLTL